MTYIRPSLYNSAGMYVMPSNFMLPGVEEGGEFMEGMTYIPAELYNESFAAAAMGDYAFSWPAWPPVGFDGTDGEFTGEAGLGIIHDEDVLKTSAETGTGAVEGDDGGGAASSSAAAPAAAAAAITEAVDKSQRKEETVKERRGGKSKPHESWEEDTDAADDRYNRRYSGEGRRNSGARDDRRYDREDTKWEPKGDRNRDREKYSEKESEEVVAPAGPTNFTTAMLQQARR